MAVCLEGVPGEKANLGACFDAGQLLQEDKLARLRHSFSIVILAGRVVGSPVACPCFQEFMSKTTDKQRGALSAHSSLDSGSAVVPPHITRHRLNVIQRRRDRLPVSLEPFRHHKATRTASETYRKLPAQASTFTCVHKTTSLAKLSPRFFDILRCTFTSESNDSSHLANLDLWCWPIPDDIQTLAWYTNLEVSTRWRRTAGAGAAYSAAAALNRPKIPQRMPY